MWPTQRPRKFRKSGTVDARREGGVWGGGLQLWWSPRENFRKQVQICAICCIFWRPVQQKMYNPVFNSDFGRSIWWLQAIKSVTENRRTEFTFPDVCPRTKERTPLKGSWWVEISCISRPQPNFLRPFGRPTEFFGRNLAGRIFFGGFVPDLLPVYEYFRRIFGACEIARSTLT